MGSSLNDAHQNTRDRINTPGITTPQRQAAICRLAIPSELDGHNHPKKRRDDKTHRHHDDKHAKRKTSQLAAILPRALCVNASSSAKNPTETRTFAKCRRWRNMPATARKCIRDTNEGCSSFCITCESLNSGLIGLQKHSIRISNHHGFRNVIRLTKNLPNAVFEIHMKHRLLRPRRKHFRRQ